MTEYDTHSRELLLHYFRKHRAFSEIRIINNRLQEIELRGVSLWNVEIQNSYLNQSLLEGMQVNGLVVKQCDLREVNWSRSSQEGVGYEDSLLLKADFSASRFYNLAFRNCVAHSIHFRDCHLVKGEFFACEMNKAKLERSLVMEVSFSGGQKGDLAGLAKASLNGSLFIDCRFRELNLNGADFSTATFINCDFTGAQLEDIVTRQSHFLGCLFQDCRPAGLELGQRGDIPPTDPILHCF